jgi:hypothetical protein
MLFGAISPALAASLFRDRPDILARMLALPAAEAQAAPHVEAAADDGCPHESVSAAGDEAAQSAHDGATGGPHDESKHAAHGIFCSFCLAVSATVTLPAAAAPVMGVQPVTLPSFSGREREPDRPQLSSHRSRAPPVSLS